jgi:hypothetical protein
LSSDDPAGFQRLRWLLSDNRQNRQPDAAVFPTIRQDLPILRPEVVPMPGVLRPVPGGFPAGVVAVVLTAALPQAKSLEEAERNC